ncbi:restriction endonuclease subunit S [Clostridium perfringens]|nr:restriction endonuclease subunit S [Clostridium perfringens]MDM1014601.1 restriction endonuclease subunit S [Clostridium perfringens]
MKKEVREGYKKYEFGLIPNDWEVKKIGDIFEDLKCGATPSRAKIEYYNGNIPWITSGELKYKTIYKTFENITENAVKDTNLTIYPKGTFFIAITGLEADGTRGSCAISGIEATTNQSCLAFRPKIGFSNQYLYQWYRFYGDYIGLKYTQGTKQQSLNNKIVGNLEIPVPKLKEQEKIAEILSTVDEQIENTEKLIQKNQELKKGLMQQLLTKGIGHTEFKKTELGYIPKEWKIMKLGEVCDFKQGFQIPRSEQINEEKDGYIRYLYITDFFSNNNKLFIKGSDKYYYIKSDDITIANTGNTCGKAFKGAEGILSNNMFKIFNNKEVLLNDFLWQYLNSNYYWKELNKYFNTAGQPHVGHKNMANLMIAIPESLNEQSEIALILSSIDKRIEKYENKKEKLKELKKGLMQQLLTGYIRLIWND